MRSGCSADTTKGCTASVCTASGWDDSGCGTSCTPGDTIACHITNQYGTCYGIRTCTSAGTWGGCTAKTPAPENCANGLDDDCDGFTDTADSDCAAPQCTDADGDGYNSSQAGCGIPDCDDTNANIHPGAIEICGNVIDEDCSGADLPCGPVCGNGILETGETCDNGVLNGACPAACSATCTLNNCPGQNCGDGLIHPGEQCDGVNWGPITDCTDFDTFLGGTLTCDPVTCLFNTSGCIGTPGGVCGDAIIQVGEQCDGVNWGPITDCTDFDTFLGGMLFCNPLDCLFNTSFCIENCRDNDSDSYSPDGGVCGLVDCNDADSEVNPGTPENCTNLIDDDCDGLIDVADPDCPIGCVTNFDCPPISCPSINGTLTGVCDNGVCTYAEPPWGCITECSDAIDNDLDGDIDYPADACCGSFADTSELCACTNDIDCVSECADGWPLPGTCINGNCYFDILNCACHPYYYYYDYNNDGLLNASDVSILVTVILGSSCPLGTVCDVNNDGVVNAQDVLNLIAIVDGSFDAGEVCDDLQDNDCDGLIDDADPDCNGCTDVDDDTYSPDGGLCGLIDCDDTNPEVNPGAAENCVNGVDDDCDSLVDGNDPECIVAICGDTIIQPGEQCDGANWGPIIGCTDFNHYIGGNLSCDPVTCLFNLSQCIVPPTTCGDGLIHPGEECDGVNWGPITDCTDFDTFLGGTLTCDPVTCLFNTSGCIGTPGGVCGDAVIQVGEECDGVNWGPITGCTAFDNFTSGVLACSDRCHFNTSLCIAPLPVCGDGIIDPGEACDGVNWGPITSCLDFDSFLGGTLACDPLTCLFNTSLCTLVTTDVCGNGIVEGMEACDQGLNNGACPALCAADCTLNTCFAPLCGDGVIQPGEQCDGSEWGQITDCTDFDTFTGGTLSCDPLSCLFDTGLCVGTPGGVCGDNVINVGEQCDGTDWGMIGDCTEFDSFQSGSLTCDPVTCLFNTSNCSIIPIQVCGNGVVEGSEECDLGLVNGACPSACSATCMLNNCTGPVCGDTIIQSGEQCDGANWGPITGCTDLGSFTGGTLSCDLITCQFDTSECLIPSAVCGDGLIHPGEECDGVNWGPITDCTDFDTFLGGTLTCDPVTCLFNTSGCIGTPGGVCGDAVIQVGEECDGVNWGPITGCTAFDNFTSGVLACSDRCHFNTSLCIAPLPVCGDGIIDPGEACDGVNWGPITSCLDFDSFQSGTLSCDDLTCQFDTSLCSVTPGQLCGNGVREGTEACDGADFGGQTCGSYGYQRGSLACTTGCAISTARCSSGGGGGGHHAGGGGDCLDGYHRVNGTCVPHATADGGTTTTTTCDDDGDGYVRYALECVGKGAGIDCNDKDWRIHPGAIERCNGVDDDCDGEIDEGCFAEEAALNYSSEIAVPLLSIVQYAVTVANFEEKPLRNAELSLTLPSTWEYDGPVELGTLHPGDAKRVIFTVLVSEDLAPTQTITVTLRSKGAVIASGATRVRVLIPKFAVRIKPSLDDYQDALDAEVFVLLQNKLGEELRDLEVEVDVNDGSRTDYVQYLDIFNVAPYAPFRYRYIYPVARLGDPVVVTGVLRQRGTVIATSNDTMASVYHPTGNESDARRLDQIRRVDG